MGYPFVIKRNSEGTRPRLLKKGLVFFLLLSIAISVNAQSYRDSILVYRKRYIADLTAQVIKTVLDKAGAASFPKTSGATGIHIYVPLGAKYSYDQAKEFAHIVAHLAQEQLPGFTSLERSLSKRGKDHIYIDFLQNRKGQTLSCAYSMRPKPGAPVSTPLEWNEVKRGLRPTDFTFRNITKRIEKKGDLFSGMLLKGIDMEKCLQKLA